MPILAYHIIWTTYGTWLPGDERGWISTNKSGIQAPDPEREHAASLLMAEDAVTLSPSQRAMIEKTITDHCRIRNWTLHALQARTNHIHVVVTADCNPDEVMKQFKAWCSRKLSDAAGFTQSVAKRAGRRHWFTKAAIKRSSKTRRTLKMQSPTSTKDKINQGARSAGARSASKGKQD